MTLLSTFTERRDSALRRLQANSKTAFYGDSRSACDGTTAKGDPRGVSAGVRRSPEGFDLRMSHYEHKLWLECVYEEKNKWNKASEMFQFPRAWMEAVINPAQLRRACGTG